MFKLIVNPGTDQSWEIPLLPGVTVLGSDPASPHAIAHDTVSPAHCEIQVADGSVMIKDLGSACGTFVNHTQITEAGLAAGQTVQLGEVELRFAADSPEGSPAMADPPIPVRIPTSIPAGTVAATTAAQSAWCKFHPKVAAAWHCGVCHASFCDLCINVRRTGDSARHLCRKCGNDCTPIAVELSLPVEENFYTSLPGAFAFPFRGHGLVIMVAGAVCFALLGLVILLGRFVPFYGLVVVFGAGLFTAGYLFSYAKEIVITSARGLNEPPDWPDFNNWSDDIVAPAFQMFCLILLTLGPAIILKWWHPLGDDYAGAARAAMLLVGVLFLPMGMLALAMFDSIGALNPVLLVWSISRILLPYLAAAGAFALVLVAYALLATLGGWLGSANYLLLMLLMNMVMGFLELYALGVTMRILGLLCRTQKERLGWPH